MADKLAAIDENRTYYFFLVSKDAGQATINMYNTLYTFVKKDEKWVNHTSNKMDMASHLIQIVIDSLPA